MCICGSAEAPHFPISVRHIGLAAISGDTILVPYLFEWSHCKSFTDGTLVYINCGCQIFKRQTTCRDMTKNIARHTAHTNMTSSTGNIFRVTGLLCGEVTGEFHAQRPVLRSFEVFIYLSLNNRLNKQLWGWLFQTSWRSLWRHCNILYNREPNVAKSRWYMTSISVAPSMEFRQLRDTFWINAFEISM